jgi:D-alanyl-D-alanine carboxypeptidase
MKILFIRLLFLALVVVGSGAIALGQTVADVDAVVQKMVDARVPAAGVTVVRDGKVILAKGYGAADRETGISANENTAFQIASVTKQFTAAATMMLVEEGKLKLDDTLGNYVADVPAKWKGVTVRQLLAQVSGIPNYTAYGRLVKDKVYTQAEILAIVKDEPHRFEPGAKWEYSNTNYFLLGMIIEKVSGKPYPEFMRERIFKPLGMTSTVINTSGLKIKDAAAGYRRVNGKWEKAQLDDPSQPWAAGAIVSTAVDLAKWAVAVGEGKLLKKTSWDEVFAPAKLTDGKPANYGFGWQVGRMGETGFIGHGGGIAGFGSYIVRFPAENLSVAVITNTSGGGSEELAFEIAGLYLPKVATVLAARETERNRPAIADADPETTKFLRGVFEAMVRGEGDPAHYSADMQKHMFPDNIKQLKGPLGSQGPIKAFELLTVETSDAGKRRVYRATFESGAKVRAHFTIDAQGKISGANVRPE